MQACPRRPRVGQGFCPLGVRKANFVLTPEHLFAPAMPPANYNLKPIYPPHPNNLKASIMPQRGILPQPRANSPGLYIIQSPSSEGGLQSHTYFLSSSILSTRTSSSETVKFACMKITDGLLSSFLRSSFRGRLIFFLIPRAASPGLG